jgi:DNA end-binding protein Ku
LWRRELDWLSHGALFLASHWGRKRIMALRSSWKGYLKLSLVSVPVQAFNVTASGGGEIHFNQLHSACNSRIKYQKVCPIHGEVSKDEIVSGYEFAKGQYAIVDPDEIEKLRSENDRAITIEEFIEPDQLDPVYLDGRNYYLVPDTPVGQKPYAVLHEAMMKRNRAGIARVVFSGRDQLVLVRPMDGLLTMSILNYDSQVRKPEAVSDEVHKPEISAQELKLAEMLIDASTAKKFDYSKYEDLYTKRLTELINAKVEGKELVAPPAEEEVPVINLMDALKQSLGKAGKAESAAKRAKPAKKMAASRRQTVARKRKSS